MDWFVWFMVVIVVAMTLRSVWLLAFGGERAAKRARLNELYAKEEGGQDLTDAEIEESVHLFYEVHPEHQ